MRTLKTPGSSALVPALVCLCMLKAATSPSISAASGYRWLTGYDADQSIAARIIPPPGYERTAEGADSFAAWLRGLPLLPAGSPVRCHDGAMKPGQAFHAAVIDLDIGGTDLQQCADAAIRLRAEYLLSRGQIESICFDFTSGDPAPYSIWREGYRPVVRGDEVTWIESEGADTTYAGFRRYMDTVFTYAGTYSLSRELLRVEDPRSIRAGDVFVQGGFPGHAVMVIDIAAHAVTGEKLVLLAQGFMPAQDVHVLKNLADPYVSPWYRVRPGEPLDTPQWIFPAGCLRRWPGP